MLAMLRTMIVEDIDYDINWDQFKAGYSFFIPCLNPKQAFKEIKPTLRRLKYKFFSKVVIEDGVRGIRVWRVTP